MKRGYPQRREPFLRCITAQNASITPSMPLTIAICSSIPRAFLARNVRVPPAIRTMRGVAAAYRMESGAPMSRP